MQAGTNLDVGPSTSPSPIWFDYQEVIPPFLCMFSYGSSWCFAQIRQFYVFLCRKEKVTFDKSACIFLFFPVGSDFYIFMYSPYKLLQYWGSSQRFSDAAYCRSNCINSSRPSPTILRLVNGLLSNHAMGIFKNFWELGKRVGQQQGAAAEMTMLVCWIGR